MVAGAFILYSIYYFELKPEYVCLFADGARTSCTSKQICDPQESGVISYAVDYSTDKSIRGWVTQYDLLCESDFAFAMIGSSFFIGAFLGSFILPRLADVVGRKPMFLLGLVLYIVSVVGLLVSTSKVMLYALVVLGGVSETGRYYVAYVYAVEILPKRVQNLGGLVIFLAFGAAKIGVCTYFVLSE